MTNAAIMIALISPISTFKTLPNSNFSFGEVEGFDAHCFFIINGIFFSSPSLSLLLLSSVYIFSFIYLFLCLHHQNYHYCYNQYTFFFRLFIPLIFFPQSAKQPVLKTHPTYFRKAEEIGMKTGLSVMIREVTQSPSKLKKNGSLSLMRFKSVLLRILVRGTLVYGRDTPGIGLGRVEKN